jgi:hypothetical protein
MVRFLDLQGRTMDWNVQLLITGAAIAMASSLLTLTAQHILALRVDNILRERSRLSRQLTAVAGSGNSEASESEPGSEMRIAHELGDLRIESWLNKQDSPVGWLIVVASPAAVGQKAPLYEQNWVKVTRYNRVEFDSLQQMPAEYQAAIIHDSTEFAVYGVCPFYNVTINDAPISAGYQRRVRLEDGDILHFDTETYLRYEANVTMVFHSGSHLDV